MSTTYPTREESISSGAVEQRVMSVSRESRAKIFEIDPITDARWRALTFLHPKASVFHQVEWLQALKACYGYEPRALTFTPPGSPLRSGFVFCQIRSSLTGKRIVSLPFSDHCEPLVESQEDFDALLSNVSENVKQNRWKYAEVRPISYEPSDRRGFATCISYYLHRLGLQRSEERLFKAFHKDSVQRKIRRAEREHLRYEEASSGTLLDSFYQLLIMTRRRQGLPPQPREWFRAVLKHLGEKAKIRVAFKDDKPIASILTISDRRTMVYKYGCSDARFNSLGGTALVFWRMIQEARANGLEAIDFGRSDLDNPGLATYKEHWGAKRSTVNYWRHPAGSARSRPERRIEYIKRLVSVAPDWTLVMLGNLLYRHIG
jgi:CelD/BcsL family acetyltransferase involved in cellulose biosynthesis